ncbi:DUF5518 domain-containing protein [Haloarcula sp. S1CR25-12]|uniref:DUF5518 domain-containing protein n=1 Tax=Haloarcula saliterrae TaxID=2950534 RepID=A0ABU2FAX3_9EURY|nr:DUF5518 domain-containing protein [Haloarcula sp. S1CR25-12]MDS0259068.1 DUF5518 domain-containing protein [Haloarcula sp. S1CR25-12]
MAEGNTLINAVIGLVASIVLSFLPFSPLFGGAVAGYLEGGDSSDGLRVGAISGVLGVVVGAVVLVLFVVVFGVFVSGTAGAQAGVLGGLGLVFLLGGSVVGVVYFVGLSAIGGSLGNYVKRNGLI